MASSGEGPPPSERSEVGRAESDREHRAGVEQAERGESFESQSFGLVTLARHVKRDGRALILFTDDRRGPA
jgi:hypothetical protein